LIRPGFHNAGEEQSAKRYAFMRSAIDSQRSIVILQFSLLFSLYRFIFFMYSYNQKKCSCEFLINSIYFINNVTTVSSNPVYFFKGDNFNIRLDDHGTTQIAKLDSLFAYGAEDP
jgi:hypothetical protein